jgi:branched-chain amino acid transport system substrate-binding protein
VILLENAAPTALKTAKPGTPQFRSALRDAIENLHEVPISHGVVNMSPTDHSGLDTRGRVMVEIEDGKWVLVK